MLNMKFEKCQWAQQNCTVSPVGLFSSLIQALNIFKLEVWSLMTKNLKIKVFEFATSENVVDPSIRKNFIQVHMA